jgi:hypothetical protein
VLAFIAASIAFAGWILSMLLWLFSALAAYTRITAGAHCL